MSTVGRAIKGLRGAIQDPLVRRGYVARLKWLAGGASLQAWSLEYRRGLTGRFHPYVDRDAEEAEQIHHCPTDCGANASLSHLYERRYTYRLSNTIVNTISGATLMRPLSEDPFFVRESISWPFESILSHGLDIPEQDQASQKFQGPATVFASSPNYYHWLIEELPLVLRTYEIAPKSVLITSANGRTLKHDQVAHHLGMELISAPITISIGHHIMPGRANDSWFIHPRDLLRLAEFGRSLTENHNDSHEDRVYVSRRNSSRSIPEESELEDILRAEGFFIAHLENMSWKDQISLFQGSRIVVGPHGAGLSNLVFTPSGATVIELTNGYHYNRCFEWITHVAAQKYIKIDENADVQSASASQLAARIMSNI